MQTGASAGALFARMSISLAVVLGLMWLAAKGLQNRGVKGLSTSTFSRAGGSSRTKRRKAPPVEVLARHGLAKGTQVAVVRTCGRTMVLGITPSGVQVLAHDGADLVLDDAAPQVVDQLTLPEGITLPEPTTSLMSLMSSDGTTPSAPGWKPVLDALRERTVRRA